jgi:hypothetical protein
LTPSEVATLSGVTIDFPIIAYAGVYRYGRQLPVVVAYGGLCWRFVNADEERPRCDIWLDVRRPDAVPAVALVRWARRMLRQAAQLGEETVYCIRDDHPNSAKLLRLAGLKRMADGVSIIFADGDNRTGEVWKWQNSRQSQPS